MVMRIRYQILGGHVHCRVFTAPAPGTTFAKNGDVVFSVEEWPKVHAKFTIIAEVVPEEWAGEEHGYGHGV